ncbi:uncharacterized protein LY79DRAFT_179754 [Colletotrichum navitas]|uniref:Zn(2)-C6 fungal-type domain-containing protein n=1 Tax=Colletotrichum navitas TaxID=681940 RepID=A0AAD8V420_9PEZI|nr:uncharacterized protein LY79DRAFT_179754 [Colletotrichum navitas]KAK1593492.1 hypothetical protein LY79DRAFT_179754 [Colletotrichum navitas]
MAGQGIKKTTRSRGACSACRARKHQCSGEQPKCAQCGINNVTCQWPQQQKRGPPKYYIVTMEKRLMQTERALCALMTQVSDDQLFSAFSQLDQSDCQPDPSAAAQSNGNVLDSVKTYHSGPVYWGNYPLNSAQDVKRWFQARASGATNITGSQRPQSIEIDLEDSGAIQSDTDTSHRNDLEEADGTVGIVSIGAGQDGTKGRQTTSRGPGENTGQEDTASATTKLSLVRQNLMVGVANNFNASSAPTRIVPGPEDHESYESAFLW